MAVGLNIDNDIIVHRVCHLACGKTTPDQTVQPVLLGGEILADFFGSKLDIRGADSLVSVLCSGFGLIYAERAVVVFLAVMLDNEILRRQECLIG